MKIPDSVATNTRILFATLGTGANRGLGLGLGRHARYWSCFSLFALTIIPTFAQSAQQHQASTEQVWRPDRVWIQYEGRPDAYLIFEVGSAWTKP